MKSFLLVIFMFGFLQISHADQVIKLMVCKKEKEVRTLRVQVRTDKKCETIYTKLGQDKIVGSGLNHKSCHKFLEDIQLTIQKAGFVCREGQSPSVSNLSEGAPQ